LKHLEDLAKGDVAGAFRQGVLDNASVVARPFIDVGTNTNSFGSKVYADTDTTSEKFKKIWDYVMPISSSGKNNPKGIFAHPFQNIISINDENATDQQKAQSISQAMELPIRVYTTDQLYEEVVFKYLDEYTSWINSSGKDYFLTS